MNVTAWLRRQGFEKAQSLRGGIDAVGRGRSRRGAVLNVIPLPLHLPAQTIPALWMGCCPLRIPSNYTLPETMPIAARPQQTACPRHEWAKETSREAAGV